MANNKVITIGREFGSGGREIGERVAKLLDIPCFDRQLVEMASEKMGVDSFHLEQFRSEEMQKLYQQYLVAGPMEYVADLFTSSGVRNARAQAVRLYATMFFFYSVYDGAEDKESAKKQFQEAVKELEKSVCKEW